MTFYILDFLRSAVKKILAFIKLETICSFFLAAEKGKKPLAA